MRSVSLVTIGMSRHLKLQVTTWIPG
uniref:Uncharacterized protein n=1 Tax=Arundo donax TaxID=35708 RepID=A0A0A8ZE72_ARUDO